MGAGSVGIPRRRALNVLDHGGGYSRGGEGVPGGICGLPK